MEMELSKTDKGGLSELMKKKRQRDGRVIRQAQIKKAIKDADSRELYGHREEDGPLGESDSAASDSYSDGDDVSSVDSNAEPDGGAGQPSASKLPKYLKRALAAPKKQRAASFKDESHFISSTPDPSKSDVSSPVVAHQDIDSPLCGSDSLCGSLCCVSWDWKSARSGQRDAKVCGAQGWAKAATAQLPLRTPSLT
jgi:hypothetical protein